MKLKKVCLLLTMLMPMAASAATISENGFPVGLWNTVHYKKNNPDRTPLNIKVCIKADGTWQSLNSTDGMGGKWKRTSDDVHLSGNGTGVGGTGDLTLITPFSMMAGTWQSWSLDKPTEQHSAFNSKWSFVGKNCAPKSK